MPLPISGIMELRARAAQGDQQAAATLQEIMGGGAPGAGGPPPGAGGPPQGMPPQAGPGGPPPQGMQMSQSQFGGGGAPVPPDVQAQQAAQLIQILRARAQQTGMQ